MRQKPLPQRLSAASLLALSIWACACSRGAAPGAAGGAPAPSQSSDPEAVVATIGDAKIKMKEVEEAVGAQLRELDEQAYDIRRQGLDQLINQQLVRKAAFAQGLTEDQYLQEAVDKRSQEPNDKEVKAFFEQNAAQLPPNAKFAEFKERIASFLKRQQQSAKAKEVFDELRKDANVSVTLKAPPKPRIQVAATGPAKGSEQAPVTIVEFSDFECPFCSRAKNVADEVVKKYDGKVRLVFRQFPLGFHQHAKKAAEAALCAHAQGKFWPFHDALFADQKNLDEASLKKLAGTQGLDAAAFDKCLADPATAKQLAEDMADGSKAGVTGTPAFFINGIMLSGAQPVEEFSRVIDAELTESR
jgi:protein-disulfide isomerase